MAGAVTADLAAGLFERVRASIDGSRLQREEGSWSCVERYTDTARHDAELALLRRYPVPVAASSEMPAAGDWLACSVHGVPALLVRQQDGSLRAFINVCRHRGAQLAPEGTGGSGRERFVCPYHSWTYATDGRCVGRPHDADFPHAPKDAASLVPLACTERFGLVWVVATPAHGFGWDAYFGALGPELEELGFTAATTAPLQRRFEQPSNWKLVLDANLESYHFAYAHRETIADLFHDNLVVHDRVDDHQRILLPKQSFRDLQGPPATLEGFARHANIIYYLFPATFLLWEGDHINGFALSPLRASAADVKAWLLVPPHREKQRDAGYWKRNYEMFWEALDEDFALAASMQKGLASGANRALCFGRNEFACRVFHESLEKQLSN